MPEPYTPERHLALAIAYGQCATRTEPDGSLVIIHPEEMNEHRYAASRQHPAITAYVRRIRAQEEAETMLGLLARCADAIAECIEATDSATHGDLHDAIRDLLARVEGRDIPKGGQS